MKQTNYHRLSVMIGRLHGMAETIEHKGVKLDVAKTMLKEIADELDKIQTIEGYEEN